jgi:hypothetical protein
MITEAPDPGFPRNQIVVARLPSEWVLKRILGLPGENIHIRDGDIWNNGAQQKKTLEEYHAQRLLVHDDRFRHAQDSFRRWITRPNFAWHVRDDGYFYDGMADTRASTSDESGLCSTMQYRHLVPVSDPRERIAVPIRDDLGYCQGLSRTLHDVRDVSLEFTFLFQGPIELSMSLIGRHASWNVTAIAPPDRGGPCQVSEGILHRLEFGHLDGRVFLAIDGETLEAFDVNIALGTFTESPFRIDVCGTGRLSLASPKIWRDVHYLENATTRVASTGGWTLDASSYLLLGDNPAVSRDARHGQAFGIIPRDQLIPVEIAK